METNQPHFPQPISEQIWNLKYRLKTPKEDVPDDETVEDTWHRIAKSTAYIPGRNKQKAAAIEIRNYRALKDFKWLPAGRITAGAGSGRNVTLFNCYVMNKIPDTLPGIFDNLKEAALTMQQGGGIGYDFSPLRPKGSPVAGVDADASGPLTFMDVWDTMCKTIMSAGSRRGAMMATMRCDHPDIEEFIDVKHDSLRLRNFNISVQVTDFFMQAVLNDWDWALVHKQAPSDTSLGQMTSGGNVVFGTDDPYIYKVVKARDLWEKIMQSTYNMAEPGVLFIDRINSENNLWFMEDITATNPCGEQPLPPYGACLLGSINLAKMVVDAFTNTAQVDYSSLLEVVDTAVEMLDSVIDTSLFPLPEQKEEALQKRRMGIGVTGLADMLFMMGFQYGSKQAAKFTEDLMKIIAERAYKTSIELAKELGPCPAMETKEAREKFVRSGYMQRMSKDIKDRILKHGIRNTHLISVAPTGTISLYAGNLSSGIEPIFAYEYTRKVNQKDGSQTEELVRDYAVKAFHDHFDSRMSELTFTGSDDKSAWWECYMVTAQDLSPEDHIRMQAAAQKWVDSSISKTINCPEDIPFEDFKDIYMQAWRTGCKGCTTYRPNDVTGSVLSVDTETKEETVTEENAVSVAPAAEVFDRPDFLEGTTYKERWNGFAYYVTFNDLPVDGGKIPFEMFIKSQNVEHVGWMDALTRMISAIFRRGGEVSFVADELKNVFDPKGGAFVKGKYVPSLAALLGETLEFHLKRIGYLAGGDKLMPEQEEISENEVQTTAPLQCPECKGFNVIDQGGCPTCRDCGHSKCG